MALPVTYRLNDFEMTDYLFQLKKSVNIIIYR